MLQMTFHVHVYQITREVIHSLLCERGMVREILTKDHPKEGRKYHYS